MHDSNALCAARVDQTKHGRALRAMQRAGTQLKQVASTACRSGDRRLRGTECSHAGADASAPKSLLTINAWLMSVLTGCMPWGDHSMSAANAEKRCSELLRAAAARSPRATLCTAHDLLTAAWPPVRHAGVREPGQNPPGAELHSSAAAVQKRCAHLEWLLMWPVACRDRQRGPLRLQGTLGAQAPGGTAHATSGAAAGPASAC